MSVLNLLALAFTWSTQRMETNVNMLNQCPAGADRGALRACQFVLRSLISSRTCVNVCDAPIWTFSWRGGCMQTFIIVKRTSYSQTNVELLGKAAQQKKRTTKDLLAPHQPLWCEPKAFVFSQEKASIEHTLQVLWHLVTLQVQLQLALLVLPASLVGSTC